MAKAALIEKRPWLLASLIAGLAFWVVKDAALPGIALLLLKAAGVAFLAVYALRRVVSLDGRLLALVMGCGALGDALIETDLTAGALSFLAGHCAAIWLYRRNARAEPGLSQRALSLALLVATPLIAYGLPDDRTAALPVAVYALGLGAMAAAAWLSRFNRYRVGLGAVMFVASDLLIFAHQGPLLHSALPGLLIWPLYYFGQLLICTGVIAELGSRR